MVPRCIDKLDIEHLLRDLSKYKPWVSPQAWSVWEEFSQTVPKLMEQPPLSWPLPGLLSHAIKASHVRAASETEAVKVMQPPKV